jgi:hypothetical protein
MQRPPQASSLSSVNSRLGRIEGFLTDNGNVELTVRGKSPVEFQGVMHARIRQVWLYTKKGM